MRRDNIPCNSYMYSLLIQSLCGSNRPNDDAARQALEIFDAAVAERCLQEIDAGVLRRLSRLVRQTSLVHRVRDIAKAHTKVGPTVADKASKAMLALVLESKYDEALRMLENDIINQEYTVPHPESMRDAIAYTGKQGYLAQALKMYNLCMNTYRDHSSAYRAADKAIFMVTNSMLIGYAQQGDMVEAKVYYDKIKAMGQYPDGNGYASLLVGAAQSTDEATDALIIYDEAKRHHVKPTTFFYNVVISKLAKARKLEQALCLFDEMQRLFRLVPNTITYSAIISACVRAGSETHACRFFDQMLRSCAPRIAPFNTMIQFYVRQKPDRPRALKYFNELRNYNVAPSAHTYKLLMEAYCMIAPYDMASAQRVLRDMERKDNIKPQPTHYATLVYSYGTVQDDINNAERVFKQAMKKQRTWAPHHDQEPLYQAMLDTLISNDRLEDAEELYQEMLRKISKSSSPYIENLFIRGYGKKGLVGKAEALFEQMSDDKIGHSSGTTVREPSTFEAMIRVYLDNSMASKAKEILDRMSRRRFPEKVVASISALLTVEN